MGKGQEKYRWRMKNIAAMDESNMPHLHLIQLMLIALINLAQPFQGQADQFICNLDARLSSAIEASKEFMDTHSVNDMSFINSETLVISGFSRPIKNEAMTLEKIKIDLPTGRVDILTQLKVAPLTKVCIEVCQIHVVNQSPNQHWQLAQVNRTDNKELWLIGQKQSKRLSGFMPLSLTIQWSNDSQLLWVTWPATENGTNGVLVSLDNMLRLISESREFPDSTSNRVTISPKENRVIVVGSDKHYVANGIYGEYRVFRNQLIQVVKEQFHETLIGAQWNSATRELFTVFADGNVLDVVSKNSKTRLLLDGAGYRQALGSLGSMVRSFYSPGPLIAYSKSKRYLALSFGKLYLFSCTKSSKQTIAS